MQYVDHSKAHIMATRPVFASTLRHTVVIMIILALIGALQITTAAAAPPPTTTLAPPTVELGVQQSWNRITFLFAPVNPQSGDQYTVSFNGLACTTSHGDHPPKLHRCTIFSTGNKGGIATLARNQYGSSAVLDTAEIEALDPGECGDVRTCPDVRVTQFPDQIQFEWDGPTGASRDHVIVSLPDGNSCRASANKAPEAPFRCTITNTGDAGGIATLTSFTTATSFVITGIEITQLGPGKCGAIPRCIDAPINFTAKANKDQSVSLDWQSHDGSEFDGAGYRVLMSDNGGAPIPVCDHLLRYLYQDNRPAAASDCLVPNLDLQVSYTFTVESYGRGRAMGMQATTSVSISSADWAFDYDWRAETDGTLYLRFEWDSATSSGNPTHAFFVRTTQLGDCMSSIERGRLFCEIKVSKTSGDSLPRTFVASLESTARTTTHPLATVSVTRPPVRPTDPVNLQVSATETNATVSWDHPDRSTAVFYGVWLTGPGLPTCKVNGSLSGRESCRLNNLKPGTTYQVHVYAQDQIGQRSETLSTSFTTESDVTPPGPCDTDGRHTKAKDRAIGKAHRQFDKKVERVSNRLENKPKRLARKIRKLGKKRDSKIVRAEALYANRCPGS